MTLMEMKERVPLLTLAEKLKLMRWLATDVDEEVTSETDIDEAEEERWDAQLRQDFQTGGPMSKLRDKAVAEYERGEGEEWP